MRQLYIKEEYDYSFIFKKILDCAAMNGSVSLEVNCF